MSAKKPAKKPEPDSPPAIDGARFTLAGEEFAVISIPKASAVEFDSLTRAENEVCRLMLSGLSNADIARTRGTSINTVENQIASIFRKLEITSRSELAALAGEGGTG